MDTFGIGPYTHNQAGMDPVLKAALEKYKPYSEILVAVQYGEGKTVVYTFEPRSDQPPPPEC